MLHSLCWHCVGRSSLHNSSQIHTLVDQIHQWPTRSSGEWMISRSPDPDWQEANLQTTSLFAWHWEISRRIVLRSACYTFGLEANLRWAAMMNQMICSLCVLPRLQTFPKILTLIIFRGVAVNVVFIYFFNMCVVLSFSIVQVLRFHCKDRLLLCAGSWV